jgi:hypothetical protein
VVRVQTKDGRQAEQSRATPMLLPGSQVLLRDHSGAWGLLPRV